MEVSMTTSDSNSYTPTSFAIADQKIGNLLNRLHDKRVCPCYTARALAFNAASMAELSVGSAEAIEMFEDIIDELREHDTPAPERGPSSETH
jgi:hypothetical protein